MLHMHLCRLRTMLRAKHRLLIRYIGPINIYGSVQSRAIRMESFFFLTANTSENFTQHPFVAYPKSRVYELDFSNVFSFFFRLTLGRVPSVCDGKTDLLLDGVVFFLYWHDDLCVLGGHKSRSTIKRLVYFLLLFFLTQNGHCYNQGSDLYTFAYSFQTFQKVAR